MSAKERNYLDWRCSKSQTRTVFSLIYGLVLQCQLAITFAGFLSIYVPNVFIGSRSYCRVRSVKELMQCWKILWLIRLKAVNFLTGKDIGPPHFWNDNLNRYPLEAQHDMVLGLSGIRINWHNAKCDRIAVIKRNVTFDEVVTEGTHYLRLVSRTDQSKKLFQFMKSSRYTLPFDMKWCIVTKSVPNTCILIQPRKHTTTVSNFFYVKFSTCLIFIFIWTFKDVLRITIKQSCRD